jgi:hypothetical protein
MSGLRGALIGLGLAGLAFGLAALAVVLSSSHDDVTGPFLVLALTLGWGFIGAGLYAWWRRPDQPAVGQLMTLVGFLWFFSGLGDSDAAWLFTVSAVFGGLWAGALIHLLVAFPGGSVKPGLERFVVRLGWAIPIVQPLALLVTARPDRSCKHDCPDNLLMVTDNETLFSAAQIVLGTAGIVMLGALCVVLVRRWRGAGRVQRRALTPVLMTGAAIGVVGVGSAVPGALDSERWTEVFDYVLIGLITLVPFAFLTGLLRSSLSRAGAVSALVERVGTTSVRDALAEALGDPRLALAYWLPEPALYVDAAGHPF